jgi:type IV pilus biogenesis protein CpaD/CtpE
MKSSSGLNPLRLALIGFVAATLAGCGLAETAASGTVGAAAEVQQAQQAQQMEQHVRDQVQASQAAAAAQRDKAEQDAQ